MLGAAYQITFGLTPFQIANVLESLLWITIGIVLAVTALFSPPVLRRLCILGALTFILFGGSDLVEAWSGAWWRPWWLLVWKGICLLVFLILLAEYYRRRKMLRQKSDQSSP